MGTEAATIHCITTFINEQISRAGDVMNTPLLSTLAAASRLHETQWMSLHSLLICGYLLFQVQLLYAKQECRGENAAIGDCRPTQQLCARFEELLRHGLKAGWFGLESSFWPLILKISRKQAIEYISR